MSREPNVWAAAGQTNLDLIGLGRGDAPCKFAESPQRFRQQLHISLDDAIVFLIT